MGAIADALGGLERAPDAPPPDACARLLEELARMIELGGATRFVRPPVAVDDALPDPWTLTPFGVGVVLLRLFAHAGLDLDVRVIGPREDRRLDARAFHVRLVEVQAGQMTFEIGGVGSMAVLDAVGAAALLALDTGTPYREAPEVDSRRGAIAASYLGFGVLAANAAFARDRTSAGWSAFRTNGALRVDDLAFLLAVQTVVRDDVPSSELDPDQLDLTSAWCVALVDRGEELRAALGLGEPETWGVVERPSPAPLTRRPIVDGAAPPAPVTRRRTSKTAVGAVVGGGVAGIAAVTVAMPVALVGAIAVGFGVVGGWIGAGIAYVRCSGCGADLADAATICTSCGGAVGTA